MLLRFRNQQHGIESRQLGNQCYSAPIVEVWGISLVTLLLPWASICVKLIGQKRREAGTECFWII